MNRRQLFRPITLLILMCLTGVAASGATRQQEAAKLSVPFESANNLIILRGSINGSRPLSLLLDTGASSSVVNESRAQELGLKLEGQGEGVTGDGSVEVAFVKGATLNVSGIEFTNLNLTAINLSGLEAGFGRSVDGILGSEVFKRFVVEIDYVSHLVTFRDPQSFQYKGAGQIIPITIEDDRPFIRAQLLQPGAPTLAGKYEFDIGQVGAITLAGPFISKNRLLESARKTLQITTGSILAGRSNARVGRLGQVQLGRFLIRNPVATFAPDTRGEEDVADYAGLIGGEMLRRFKITVDYSRQRVILEPNKNYAEAFEFDMSGASLAAGGADFKLFKVRTLVEASPAMEAGLRVGDIITAIDGKPAATLTLDQIRRMFRQEGRSYALGIKRADSPLQIKLKTRRLI